MGGFEFMVYQVLVDELLEVILLIFVHVQIFAVEIKQAVSQLTAGEGTTNKAVQLRIT